MLNVQLILFSSSANAIFHNIQLWTGLTYLTAEILAKFPLHMHVIKGTSEVNKTGFHIFHKIKQGMKYVHDIIYNSVGGRLNVHKLFVGKRQGDYIM